MKQSLKVKSQNSSSDKSICKIELLTYHSEQLHLGVGFCLTVQSKLRVRGDARPVLWPGYVMHRAKGEEEDGRRRRTRRSRGVGHQEEEGEGRVTHSGILDQE